MKDKFTTLDIGKRYEFASIEDVIAVSNGIMSMEEAQERVAQDAGSRRGAGERCCVY